MRILFLNKREVERLLDMREVMDVVEKAFKEKGLGLVEMPPKVYVSIREHNGDFRVMPAYLKGLNVAGVKIVSVYPDNPRSYQLPTVLALVELLDPKTGMPMAIMDGTSITTFRTGAAGGIAVKYLARRNSRVIAIIGAGVQGRGQLMAINEVLKGKISEVKVYDIKREASLKFKKEMEEKLGLNVIVAEEPEYAVRGADIIVTVTPARGPIVRNEWIEEGVHINAIGADAPGKEELDPMILRRAKIIVDDIEQAIHSGEVNVPIRKGIISERDIYAELSEILLGSKVGRISDEEITIFDSTGLALQDICTGWLVYRKALKAEVGTWLEV